MRSGTWLGRSNSILAQSFRDFELIISDNGSTDRTAQICRDYASRDSRIRYLRHEVNRGAAWNHNNVLYVARGEYFKWNSYDDRLAPAFLEKCVAVLDRTPEAVLCFSKYVDVDANGKASPPWSAVGTWLARPHERFRQQSNGAPLRGIAWRCTALSDWRSYAKRLA